MHAPASSPPAEAGTPPTVAMVGAGQLARMTHQAAIALDVSLRVLAAAKGEPAVRAGAAAVLGAPDRLGDLRELARGARVVTFDHEGIPPEHLAALEAEGIRLAPTAAGKLLAQDKLHARRRLAEHGFPVPPFTFATAADEVAIFAAEHGWPVVAKTPRGGYDGRGVLWLADEPEAQAALAEHPAGLLLEPSLDLQDELAILVGRSASGEQVVYPVVRTVQRDGMCREILAPAPVPDAVSAEARSLAERLVETFDLTGIVALELFLTADGLLVNELALRPHNSGHYTIEGCTTSQFEQHVRAVLDWPLGDAALSAPAVATVNVVGPADGSDPRERVPVALAVPGAHVHMYGKGARPGRKLGHVTVCGEDPARTLEAARRAAALLEGGDA